MSGWMMFLLKKKHFKPQWSKGKSLEEEKGGEEEGGYLERIGGRGAKNLINPPTHPPTSKGGVAGTSRSPAIGGQGLAVNCY